MEIYIDVKEHLTRLLEQEDTDGDNKITVEDKGPKCFKLKSTVGKLFEVTGTYFLSNLLQELVICQQAGDNVAAIQSEKLFEEPVNRISRMIREYYWDGLTRRLDEGGIEKSLSDTKTESGESLIYVPFGDKDAIEYYDRVARENPDLRLKVIKLPEHITPDYVRSINDKPGILSLALEKDRDGNFRGKPYVVPGGRFNEFYGWDSYFESIGLIIDGRVDLAKAMVDNFIYEINHYGKILNANRSYYLTRSQPPFLTTMAFSV